MSVLKANLFVHDEAGMLRIDLDFVKSMPRRDVRFAIWQRMVHIIQLVCSFLWRQSTPRKQHSILERDV